MAKGLSLASNSCPSRRIVQQLDHREAESDFHPPPLVAVALGTPSGVVVAKDGKAHDFPSIILVEDAVVVDEHPHGKIALVVHLDLDVDQDPLFHPALEPDLEKLIDVPPARYRNRGRFAAIPFQSRRMKKLATSRSGSRTTVGARRRYAPPLTLPSVLPAALTSSIRKSLPAHNFAE